MKKKKSTTPSAEKRARSGSKREKPYPDNDPEWGQLESRYSQISDDMKKLAELLPLD